MTLTNKSFKAIAKGILTRKSPVYVQFAVSKGCNLQCKMCGAVEARKQERQLNLDEIERLSEILDEIGVGVLVLTGGEPMLRTDLPEIVKIFSKRGFDLKLQTNGVLATEEKVSELIKAGIKDVSISLDTLDEKKQDYICNREGTWKKVVQSLALFSEKLPQQGNMSIINSVLSKLTYKDIPGVIKFTTEIGFYNSIIPVHTANKNDFIVRNKSTEFAFEETDYSEIDSVYNKIISMKKQGYHAHNSFSFLKACPDFLKYKTVNWKCDSPYLYFSISPGGVILPCVDLFGKKNMLDKDFLSVYDDILKSLREKVKSCPGCMYACYPEISEFIKNPLTLMERFFQGRKIAKFKRERYDYEDMLKIAARIRGEK